MVVICSALLAAIVGLVGWKVFDLKPLYAAILVVASVLGPNFALLHMFDSFAEGAAIGGFHEFWGGTVSGAGVDVERCYRDGACAHTYDCDPYLVTETHYTRDSKGNVTGSHTTTRTEYHSCPYATTELTFYITTSFGDRVDVDSDVFDASPAEWRAGSGLPAVQRGPSPTWTRYKTELDSGSAPPATKVNEYKNFILASGSSIEKDVTVTDISRYRKRGMLPPHTVGVTSSADPEVVVHLVSANKMSFVKVQADAAAWNDSLARLNARLGTELQGDLHVVAVNASLVDDPQAYLNALKADWVNNYGKWALPKNAIIVVLGVDATKVKFAVADTGMPFGNNEMKERIRMSLNGVDFTQQALFGTTTATPGNKPKFTTEGGKLADILFKETPFKRPCMVCDDPGENHAQGFVYLGDMVIPNIPWYGRILEMLLIAVVDTGVLMAAVYAFNL